jgi:hypothetical protein
MTPHDRATLLMVMLGIIAILIILALKRRGMRGDETAQSPRPARTVTTRIQTVVKLARHSGDKSGFPLLRVMCMGPTMSKLDRVEVKAVRDDGREAHADAKIAAGTPINPEPGDEIDLSAAFRQIAAELCHAFASKTRVKYSVALQESVQGRTIPIETPQRTADLWQDGLEDIITS